MPGIIMYALARLIHEMKSACAAGTPRDCGRALWVGRFRRGRDLSSRRGRFAERVGRGDNGPAVYGRVGIRAAAMWRKSAASGQAAAKARRTREAVSMTRVPSFKRRKRMVVNSAV